MINKNLLITWIVTGIVGALLLALILIISFKAEPESTTGYAGLETNISNSIRDKEHDAEVMDDDSYNTLIELYDTYDEETYYLALVYVLYHFEKEETGYLGFGVDFKRNSDNRIFSNVFSSEYLENGKLINLSVVS